MLNKPVFVYDRRKTTHKIGAVSIIQMRAVCQKGISITNSALVAALVDFCDISSEHIVLDIGCGRGRITAIMDKYAHTVIGIDLNPVFLLQAKNNFVNVLMAKDKLPFSDCLFDKVILFHVIEHLNCENVERLISEVGRVLKPEGQVVVGVPICGYVSWFIWKFRSTFLNPLAMDHFGADDHKQFYTYKRFIAIFKNNNFNSIHGTRNLVVSNSFGFLALKIWKILRFLPMMLDTVNIFERTG